MHKNIAFKIEGTCPLLLNNGQLADPSNAYAKAIKAAKGQTDAKILERHELTWEGSLYLDEKQRVVIPGENIESAIAEASTACEKGAKKLMKAGVFSMGLWPLIYSGPKTLAGLKADPRFQDTRLIKAQGNKRLMYRRPKFVEWSLAFEITYDDQITDADKVRRYLEYAGAYVAIGAYRPKYGRFRVVA